jgi:hypothetical protein
MSVILPIIRVLSQDAEHPLDRSSGEPRGEIFMNQDNNDNTQPRQPQQPLSSSKAKLPRHRESSPDDEAVARYIALPLRRMTGWTGDGMQYVLECGHTLPSDAFLDDNACLRCPQCYVEGMLRAKKMMDK